MEWKSISTISIIACTLLSSPCWGQSNFDLNPPGQATLESHQILLSPDPASLPTFQFAVAEMNEEGEFLVITSRVNQELLGTVEQSEKPPRGFKFVKELVPQNYTVAVPYTEKLDDGSVVNRVRTETRTRNVMKQTVVKMTAEEMTEFKKQEERKAKEEESTTRYSARLEMVSVPYTTRVQYAEATETGEVVHKTKTVTRTRTVQVERGDTKTEVVFDNETYPNEGIDCFNVRGEKLELEKLKEIFSERQPVILVNSEKAITPYFETILKPGTIFMVIK